MYAAVVGTAAFAGCTVLFVAIYLAYLKLQELCPSPTPPPPPPPLPNSPPPPHAQPEIGIKVKREVIRFHPSTKNDDIESRVADD